MKRVLLCVVVFGLTACAGDDGGDGDDAPPTCVALTVDPEVCAPLFPAEYDRIYDSVLVGTEDAPATCGQAGGSCHATADASGAAAHGLVFAGDRDALHALLIDGGYVVPGDPACSPLVVRLETDESRWRMPPGASGLDEGVRCAIVQWVANGAEP